MVKVVAVVTFKCCFCQPKFWKVVLWLAELHTCQVQSLNKNIYVEMVFCGEQGSLQLQGGPALSRLLSGWGTHQWHRSKLCAHGCWGGGEGKLGQTPLPPWGLTKAHQSPLRTEASPGLAGMLWLLLCEDSRSWHTNELLTPSGSRAFLFWYVFNLGLLFGLLLTEGRDL